MEEKTGSEAWWEYALSHACVQYSKTLAVMFRQYASRGKSPNTGAFISPHMLSLMNSAACNGTYRNYVGGALPLPFIHVCIWCEPARSLYCRESCLWLWDPAFCWWKCCPLIPVLCIAWICITQKSNLSTDTSTEREKHSFVYCNRYHYMRHWWLVIWYICFKSAAAVWTP